MSESGSGGDRERLGRETGESGRTDHGSPEESGRTDHSSSETGYQRERTDTEASQQQAQSQQYTTAPAGSHTSQSTGTGWGIAAIVVSILALLASVFSLLNLILAIPGIILGIVARRKGSRGLGLTAIIISILAILIAIVLTLLVGAAVLNSPEFQQMMQES